jgi:hypothetical protein
LRQLRRQSLQLAAQGIAARGIRPTGIGPAECQTCQVIAHGAVDQVGGSAQLVGDSVHRRDVDPGSGECSVSSSTIESHA